MEASASGWLLQARGWLQGKAREGREWEVLSAIACTIHGTTFCYLNIVYETSIDNDHLV
jgi:hypothetical protein